MLYVKGFLVALQGVPVTVGVTLIAMVTGAVLGLVLALMKMSRIKVLTALASLYIEVIRGTPLIVQALIMAYGLPQLMQSIGINFRWTYLIIPAIIVCGLNSAAYVAEVIRSGIQAVDKGQMEAARSIGMTKRQAMQLIVIPQALKIVLPSFGNEFVSLIKETSVLSYVGVVEILRKGALWNAATFNTFEAYIGVALVYMLLTIPSSKLVKRLEKKMSTDSAN
ncbi:MAG TPA: amino acid ABC transporter permease [Ruminococcaceae bacterium]|nr:amino acid ABC transporter permease [Oscillospiraceae bacterium]MDD5920360.1 amino acid ABC transporter permease [Oscillospiraceae bacterium]HAG56539.1 amino acid ABC transporter permease [Oscillospiraceae bacterium]HAO69745.1 amino acid ABC transporter permease [Oscillospiraceae bacterium]HCB65486.1 amino acid ABC transporter permease [Oscillospiraceae bacterium]